MLFESIPKFSDPFAGIRAILRPTRGKGRRIAFTMRLPSERDRAIVAKAKGDKATARLAPERRKAARKSNPERARSVLSAPREDAAVADPACRRVAGSKPRTHRTTEPRSGTRGLGYDVGEFVVYPAHGVGEIIAIDERAIAGLDVELFIIRFDRVKMTLMVPISAAACRGMRKLADVEVIQAALGTLAGRARIKRATWARRALECRAKINSGDLIASAEVVRDLFRSPSQPEQSGAEREMYEAALDRVVREIALVRRLTETESLNAIEAQLRNKSGAGKSGGNDVRNRSLAAEVH